jgi:hypothetical protein
MCQRLGSGIFFWDFAVLGKDIRKREWFMVVDLSEVDRRVALIRLTLITSIPRLTSPSATSSARVFCGRCRFTAFIGLSDLG